MLMSWRERRSNSFGERTREARGERRLLFVLSALVMSGAAVLAAAGCASAAPQTKGSRTPNSIVLDAIHSTQQHRTALVQMSISSAGLPDGSTVGGTGSGQIDFATGAMKVTFDYSCSPKLQGLKLRELTVGGHLYIAPSQNGQSVPSLLPGKEWVANPGNLSNQLSGQAATIRPTCSGLWRLKGTRWRTSGHLRLAGWQLRSI